MQPKLNLTATKNDDHWRWPEYGQKHWGEKTWDNFYTNLTLKYRKNKTIGETRIKNYK